MSDTLQSGVRILRVIRWGVLWRSKNIRDGVNQHIVFDGLVPALFVTRRQARSWIDAKYGYIRTRDDLKREPFGWRVPIPVRVTITCDVEQQRMRAEE